MLKFLRRLFPSKDATPSDVQLLETMFNLRKLGFKQSTEAIVQAIAPSLDGVCQFMIKIGDMKSTERVLWENVLLMDGDGKIVFISGSVARKATIEGKEVDFDFPIRVAFSIEIALERDPAKVVAFLENQLKKSTTQQVSAVPQPEFELDKLTPEQRASMLVEKLLSQGKPN